MAEQRKTPAEMRGDQATEGAEADQADRRRRFYSWNWARTHIIPRCAKSSGANPRPDSARAAIVNSRRQPDYFACSELQTLGNSPNFDQFPQGVQAEARRQIARTAAKRRDKAMAPSQLSRSTATLAKAPCRVKPAALT
jgi:hypothetical protein